MSRDIILQGRKGEGERVQLDIPLITQEWFENNCLFVDPSKRSENDHLSLGNCACCFRVGPYMDLCMAEECLAQERQQNHRWRRPGVPMNQILITQYKRYVTRKDMFIDPFFLAILLTDGNTKFGDGHGLICPKTKQPEHTVTASVEERVHLGNKFEQMIINPPPFVNLNWLQRQILNRIFRDEWYAISSCQVLYLIAVVDRCILAELDYGRNFLKRERELRDKSYQFMRFDYWKLLDDRIKERFNNRVMVDYVRPLLSKQKVQQRQAQEAKKEEGRRERKRRSV